MDTRNPWNVESVGHLSARCNTPLWRVTRAMALLGITPIMVIDGVDHLREADAQRVAECIAGAAEIERQRIEARRKG